MTYLGAVESDRGDYQRAAGLLEQAVAVSLKAGETRRQAYGLSMLGRVSLFRGNWVGTMRELASRAGMRELELRSLRYGGALGNEGDAATAAVLAEEIEVHEHRDPPAGVSLRS